MMIEENEILDGDFFEHRTLGLKRKKIFRCLSADDRRDDLLLVKAKINLRSEIAQSNSFRISSTAVVLCRTVLNIAQPCTTWVSPYMIQHVANLLGDEMLKTCQNAKAVDVLGLGTINQNEERNLIKGKGVKITGSRLKVMGENSGIWFAPLESAVTAVSKTVKVSA